MTRRTRLAPSPTGALHLGNARTFLINWALARQGGWQVLLRIEDLDHPRVKPDTIDDVRTDLTWLGMDWDEEVPLQSTDIDPCIAALTSLARAGLVYPCSMTRSQIAAVHSAPQVGDVTSAFPKSLRPGDAGDAHDDPALDINWRLMVGDTPEPVEDAVAGAQTFDLATTVGDFPVWTRRGVPAYQLAVVVDDARQGVTDVVRGDDLLDSAARQQVLYRHLDAPVPRWWHVPLVRGQDGRRLAKRHGDTRLARFRNDRCCPEKVVGLMAAWCGILDHPEPLDAADFAQAFDIQSLPEHDITLSNEDLTWLAS